MALKKEQKIEIVKDLEAVTKAAKTIVFVNFHGLLVSEATELRRKLREQNVGYKVAKKTLVKRALDTLKIEGEMPAMEGEMAIAYSEDLIAPAREVYSFQKEHKDHVKILGGIFDGKYFNQAEMLSIATIPSIQVLRGQFVNLINSPIQRFAVVLGQIAGKK